MNVDDTIVAVSSPPGAAARGIVRLTGTDALPIAAGLFRPTGGAPVESPGGPPRHPTASTGPPQAPGPCREASLAFLRNVAAPAYLEGHVMIGRSELPAALYLFRQPRSYTRQDVVEFHLLGAPAVLGLLTEACIARGARRAEPGEFTARAFLSGALDLSQVHGIAGVIAARSDLQLQAAERLLHGDLSETAGRAREMLADLLSLVEGTLDFADEPIEFITPAELAEKLAAIHDALRSTAEAGLRAERWGELPQIAIVGRPNVGKSSLLNRLTGLDRAICAPVPGTTRDRLSAPLELGDIACLLVDAAGLTDAVGEVDAKAQAATGRAVRDADLLLVVTDLTRPETAGAASDLVRHRLPIIVVGNKVDLLSRDGGAAAADALSATRCGPVCLTSAVTGEGCEALKRRIVSALTDRPARAGEAAIALVAEHREALREAVAAVARAIRICDCSPESLAEADLVAAELHAAADALGRLVGRDPTEAMLGRIFSRFCVGK
ncbi:MAG: tRNA modification GTPase [Phycisphaerae bacterium]